jgi:hypothetical protein
LCFASSLLSRLPSLATHEGDHSFVGPGRHDTRVRVHDAEGARGRGRAVSRRARAVDRLILRHGVGHFVRVRDGVRCLSSLPAFAIFCLSRTPA